MKDFENWGKGEGGYMFISHSHLDIEKVRKIRNALEEAGFDPLCFYLKCLTDEDEVEGLIKREIDAREWFVYIDSENSRNSKWVTKERNYIQNLENKNVFMVNLDSDKPLENISESIIKAMRVFISNHNWDRIIAKQLADSLIKKDLQVYIDTGLELGADYFDTRRKQIEDAANHGCIIMLISDKTFNSSFCKFAYIKF